MNLHINTGETSCFNDDPEAKPIETVKHLCRYEKPSFNLNKVSVNHF